MTVNTDEQIVRWKMPAITAVTIIMIMALFGGIVVHSRLLLPESAANTTLIQPLHCFGFVGSVAFNELIPESSFKY
jgi:hypothetical protein